MKTAFTFALLFSAAVAFGQYRMPDGSIVDTIQSGEYGGVFWNGTPPQKYLDAEGIRLATPAEIDARAAEAQAASIAAEAARIAGKSVELKMAENAFLTALYGYNADYSLGLTADDSFQSAMQKLKDSTTGERIDRIEAGLVLRTLWDVVLFHGGRWGDTQFHQEVEQ